MRERRTSRASSGTGSGLPVCGSASRSARMISSEKNGFPCAASCTLATSGAVTGRVRPITNDASHIIESEGSDVDANRIKIADRAREIVPVGTTGFETSGREDRDRLADPTGGSRTKVLGPRIRPSTGCRRSRSRPASTRSAFAAPQAPRERSLAGRVEGLGLSHGGARSRGLRAADPELRRAPRRGRRRSGPRSPNTPTATHSRRDGKPIPDDRRAQLLRLPPARRSSCRSPLHLRTRGPAACRSGSQRTARVRRALLLDRRSRHGSVPTEASSLLEAHIVGRACRSAGCRRLGRRPSF